MWKLESCECAGEDFRPGSPFFVLGLNSKVKENVNVDWSFEQQIWTAHLRLALCSDAEVESETTVCRVWLNLIDFCWREIQTHWSMKQSLMLSLLYISASSGMERRPHEIGESFEWVIWESCVSGNMGMMTLVTIWWCLRGFKTVSLFMQHLCKYILALCQTSCRQRFKVWLRRFNTCFSPFIKWPKNLVRLLATTREIESKFQVLLEFFNTCPTCYEFSKLSI